MSERYTLSWVSHMKSMKEFRRGKVPWCSSYYGLVWVELQRRHVCFPARRMEAHSRIYAERNLPTTTTAPPKVPHNLPPAISLPSGRINLPPSPSTDSGIYSVPLKTADRPTIPISTSFPLLSRAPLQMAPAGMTDGTSSNSSPSSSGVTSSTDGASDEGVDGMATAHAADSDLSTPSLHSGKDTPRRPSVTSSQIPKKYAYLFLFILGSSCRFFVDFGRLVVTYLTIISCTNV